MNFLNPINDLIDQKSTQNWWTAWTHPNVSNAIDSVSNKWKELIDPNRHTVSSNDIKLSTLENAEKCTSNPYSQNLSKDIIIHPDRIEFKNFWLSLMRQYENVENEDIQAGIFKSKCWNYTYFTWEAAKKYEESAWWQIPTVHDIGNFAFWIPYVTGSRDSHIMKILFPTPLLWYCEFDWGTNSFIGSMCINHEKWKWKLYHEIWETAYMWMKADYPKGSCWGYYANSESSWILTRNIYSNDAFPLLLMKKD